MFHLNHPLLLGGREGTAGMMLEAGQGLALGVHWDVLGGAKGGCWAHGHDHSPSAHSTEHCTWGGTASLPELQTPKYLWENFALKMRTRDFIAFSCWKASLSNLCLSGGSCSPHIFSGAVESPLGA